MSRRLHGTFWARAARVALPAYWALLSFATHYPSVRIPTDISYRDKVVHVAAFGLLAFLYWQFVAARRPVGDRFVWTSGAVLIAYAALDEYLQQYVGRFTDLLDFIANMTGIVLVLGVLELRRRARRS